MLGVLYWHPACFGAWIFFFLIINSHHCWGSCADYWCLCVFKCCCNSKGFVYKIFLNSLIVFQLILWRNIITINKMKLISNHPYLLTLTKISESSTVNQIYLIVMCLSFSCHMKCVLHSYNNQRKTNVRDSRVKSITKANTDHQNGEVNQNIWTKI